MPDLTREQVHALWTVYEHPVMSARELAHFYNTECYTAHYDDVPETSPGGMATRLAYLRQRGWVVSLHAYAPIAWEITAEGQRVMHANLVNDSRCAACSTASEGTHPSSSTNPKENA